MRIDFCLPIYNEEKILAESLRRLFDYCQANFPEFNWQIICLINGSTDQSFFIANKFSQSRQQVIVKNYTEAGRGQALKNYWEKSEADIVAYMDADLATSLDNLQKLIQPIINKQTDLVIGSRLLNTSNTKRKLSREIISRAYIILSKLILQHNFSDLQCGFKAIKTESFKKISPYLADKKWFFDTELIALAQTKNLRVVELPVSWSENRYAVRQSKVRPLRDGFLFLKNLLQLKKRLKKIQK